jgi:hypothetical protein
LDLPNTATVQADGIPPITSDQVLITVLDGDAQNGASLVEGEGAGSAASVASPLDVNLDGNVSPLDAVLVINYLNSGADAGAADGESSGILLDVNGDNSVSPIDAVLIINELNANSHNQSAPTTEAVDLSSNSSDESSSDELLTLLASDSLSRPRRRRI